MERLSPGALCAGGEAGAGPSLELLCWVLLSSQGVGGPSPLGACTFLSSDCWAEPHQGLVCQGLATS